ncbi:MAG: sodium:proton antiporter [Clostridiales Family XIII bacterium]|jgi:CPA1 family monovalent cation:H+ antiporter|nr:sodium:proton antiporter [Clostridiales Family XIII bacterium]
MEVTAVVIGILSAIVLSNVLSHMIPGLPLPLLQIVVGCALGFTFLREALELEPEIFMVMVIAPLLFHEADETNMFSLWKVGKQVLIMAFLLVFVTVVAVGLVTDRILATIPLAGCFALGAILGPTDAVAVMSLRTRIKISGNVKNILMGEGLINDASGLIAFGFAVNALITGSFSLGDAFVRLLIVSFGGFLVGFALSSAERSLVKTLRGLAVRHTATYVLIELMMPFICYMAAEAIGVSGILAAVAAGSRQTPRIRQAKRLEAEFGAAKETVWDMVTFSLNSMVFLLLGLQLPHTLTSVWNNAGYNHLFLVLVVILVTLILLTVRLISVLAVAWGVVGASPKEKVRNSLVLTLSGVKGTVSMATAFALPAAAVFPERNLLVFIAAGVIVTSLLIAIALLPLVADNADKGDNRTQIRTDIINETIKQLREQDEPPDEMVVMNLKKRIEELEFAEYSKKERIEQRALRMMMFRAERESVREMKARNEISERTYNGAMELLYMIYKPGFKLLAIQSALWFAWMNISRHRDWVRAMMPAKEHMKNLMEVFQKNFVVVEALLHQERKWGTDRVIDRLIHEREELLGRGAPRRRFVDRLNTDYEKGMLNAFYVERRVIHQFLINERITPEEANAMRVDVNGLESYILTGNHGETASDINALIKRWRPEAGNLSE